MAPEAAAVPATPSAGPEPASPEAAMAVVLRWRISQRLCLALVTTAFPFLFILDEAADLPLSPVLPGMLVAVLVLVALPFAVNESLARRHRMDGPRLARLASTSRLLLGLACAWLLLWLAWGA